MANTPQAKKRIRRNEKRADINGARLSRIRNFLKKVEVAIEGGDKDNAQAALKAAQPELARGVARGVFHKNTAARKMSRLSKRVSALCFALAGPPAGKDKRGRRSNRRPFWRFRVSFWYAPFGRPWEEAPETRDSHPDFEQLRVNSST